jgi:hypothetical protein
MTTRIGYYVTLQRGDRTAWLLGPFDQHDDAKANVAAAVAKANELDPWTHFDAYGTSSITRESDKPLPAGKLNHLLSELLLL